MFKVTCLVAHKWIDRSPHIGLKIPWIATSPSWNHLIMGTQSMNMQQTCIMNAWNERVNDFQKFGARITEIGIAVAKIWRKEFQGPIQNFWKVARALSRNIFNFQGCCLEIWGSTAWFWIKAGAFLQSGGDSSVADLFFIGERHGLVP
jgi:hypothetical protein